MVNQKEAEQIAQEVIQGYIDRCAPDNIEDAGNLLMKLVSVAGIFMSGVCGKEDAVSRLEATADFIDSLKVTAEVRPQVMQ